MSKKKTPAPKRAAKRTTPVSVPPIVAALARFTDPDIEGLDPDFVRAWAAVPTIVRCFQAGTHDANNTRNHHTVIRELADAHIARSRKGNVVRRRTLAQVVDDLSVEHDDLMTELEIAFTGPAFNVGLAVGLYLLTEKGGAR